MQNNDNGIGSCTADGCICVGFSWPCGEFLVDRTIFLFFTHYFRVSASRHHSPCLNENIEMSPATLTCGPTTICLRTVAARVLGTSWTPLACVKVQSATAGIELA